MSCHLMFKSHYGEWTKGTWAVKPCVPGTRAGNGCSRKGQVCFEGKAYSIT